ncbi:hypothetical protein [Streptomyces sp. NPDC127066]|uniref:hypothetical protein n=1 Tax=Streptomyces sp. NPDC127066 TaxID=3347125 RepID=UPI003648DCE1
MSKKPDLFEDLRRVGEFKRDRMHGRPADNALAKITQSGVSRDTVGAWLRGDRCPQRLAPLLAVIAAIRVEAFNRGLLETSAGTASGESVADLLAEDRWSGSWAAEQERRKQVGREGLERQQGHKTLEDEERRARQAALTDRPRPVRSWTLQRLGVHPAVSGHRADMEGSEFVVPSYVHRPMTPGCAPS